MWWYPGINKNDGESSSSSSSGGGGGSIGNDGKKYSASSREVLQLRETFHTSWNTFELRLRVGRWLHTKLQGLVSTMSSNVSGRHRFECLSYEAATDARLINPMVVERPSRRVSSCNSANEDTNSCQKEEMNGGNLNENMIEDERRFREEDKPYTLGDVPGMRVDLNIINNSGEDVQVWRAKSRDHGILSPEPVAIVEIGKSIRLVGADFEQWRVDRKDGTTVKTWIVDLGFGIVQDIVVT